MPGPDRPLRIAHVTATFPPYLAGAGNVAFELADRLARRGNDVEVFTADAPGSPPECAALVHRLAPRFAIGNAPLLPSLARLRGFDVVHLHYPFIFGTELLLAGRVGPLVVQVHNQLIGEGLRAPLFAGWERTVGRAVLARAARVAVVSRAHGETVPGVARIARRSPERIAELPNGVDVERFSPGPSRGGDGDLVAVYVAALDRAHYLKRPDLALEAVARAQGVRLVMVGGGEWLPDLRARAAELGIAERVTFLGAVPPAELPDVLRGADVFLNTSDLESFGLVLIEAMACGLPVVSTATVGARGLLSDACGFLVPVGDADALGAALTRVADLDPAARVALGAAGRASVEADYAWDSVVDRCQTIYADVARTQRRTVAPR